MPLLDLNKGYDDMQCFTKVFADFVDHASQFALNSKMYLTFHFTRCRKVNTFFEAQILSGRSKTVGKS